MKTAFLKPTKFVPLIGKAQPGAVQKTIVLQNLLEDGQIKAISKILTGPYNRMERAFLLMAFLSGIEEQLLSAGVNSDYLGYVLLSSVDINKARERAQACWCLACQAGRN